VCLGVKHISGARAQIFITLRELGVVDMGLLKVEVNLPVVAILVYTAVTMQLTM
jgi:hypothetical protein